jgi:hypothetical protein
MEKSTIIVIAFMAITLGVCLGFPILQQMQVYGCFGPRVGYGYVIAYGEHWVWFAPQTDHELLMGNFTLAEGVNVPSWVNSTYGFPTAYTISWGIITNLNPY